MRHFNLPEQDKYHVDRARLLRVAETDAALDAAAPFCASYRRAVDVGAFVGVASIALAQRFNAVEAFEPHPFRYASLLGNLEGNPRITTRRIALGAEEGVAMCNLAPRNESLLWQPSLAKMNGASRVPLRSLDSYELNAVDLLHIGPAVSALPVLQGARETLARCQPVVITTQIPNHDTDKTPTVDAAGISAFFADVGYAAVAGPEGVALFAPTGRVERTPLQLEGHLISQKGQLWLSITGPQTSVLGSARVRAQVDGAVLPLVTQTRRTKDGPVCSGVVPLAGPPREVTLAGLAAPVTVPLRLGEAIALKDLLNGVTLVSTTEGFSLSLPTPLATLFDTLAVQSVKGKAHKGTLTPTALLYRRTLAAAPDASTIGFAVPEGSAPLNEPRVLITLSGGALSGQPVSHLVKGSAG